MSKTKKMKIIISLIAILSFVALGCGAYAVDTKQMPDSYIAIPLCTFIFVIYVWGRVMTNKIKY